MKALICGGFGFSGQYLVYFLLKKGYKVILLGRAKGSLTLNKRLQILIDNNSLVSSEFKIAKDLFAKITILEGDIAKPGLGLAHEQYDYILRAKPDKIYNLAACLRYEEKYRNKLFQTNVEGTKQLLELAKQIKCKYIHISTAYIAGTEIESGTVIEEKYYESENFPNVYLESKACAEHLIRDYSKKFKINYNIFRFPTLIGDSETGFTNSIFGFYEYIAAISAIKRKNKANEQIRFMASPKGAVNLLPVDIVVKCLCEIDQQSNINNQIFNLTDNNPLSPSKIGDIINRIFELKLVAVNNCNFKEEATWLEKLFSRLTSKNSSFATRVYLFDSKNSELYLGRSVSSGWEKSKDYFLLLKSGFDRHVESLKK